MALFVFGIVLLLSAAATSDQLSRITGVAIEPILWVFRFAVILVPAALGFGIAWYSRRRLARRDLAVAEEESGESQVLAGAAPHRS